MTEDSPLELLEADPNAWRVFNEAQNKAAILQGGINCSPVRVKINGQDAIGVSDVNFAYAVARRGQQ